MDADKKASEIRERKTHVLFVCTHNSARSQMGEGYLRAHYGDLFEVGSAGTEVLRVNPAAIVVMEEIGIDISGHRSKLIDEFFDKGIDIVITVCDSAHQACPFFPGAKMMIHAGFPDPSACTGTPGECLTQFRQVRDDIIAWIDTVFVPEYGHLLPVF
jgi:arsenate reductase (thioredoxin)